MKEQSEFLIDALRLKKENEDHEIRIMVDTDILNDDDYTWVSGSILSVTTGVWLETEWGIKTTVAEITEFFWETDEIYPEGAPDNVPELVDLIAKAKPVILVRVGF